MNGSGRLQVVAMALVILIGSAGVAAAQGSGVEVWLSGGVQGLNENDTSVPDAAVNIPVVASIGYPLSSRFTVEGEFAWMVPVEQSMDIGSGDTGDYKSPDVLSYQANLRANFGTGAWRPYLVAGAGAATFLENTDADRMPALSESETMFAANFGAGVTYLLSPRWSLRADARGLVAFPSDDSGLAQDGEADEVWMERGTIGFGYHF